MYMRMMYERNLLSKSLRPQRKYIIRAEPRGVDILSGGHLPRSASLNLHIKSCSESKLEVHERADHDLYPSHPRHKPHHHAS